LNPVAETFWIRIINNAHPDKFAPVTVHEYFTYSNNGYLEN